jgi:IS30 family transposase
LIVGPHNQGQCLLVLTERLTRYTIIRKLKDKKRSTTLAALKEILVLPNIYILTITQDRGNEFD